MHSITLLLLLASCAYGAQLNSYLPPRPGVGAGGGLITAPGYPGGGGVPGGPFAPGVPGGSYTPGAPGGAYTPGVPGGAYAPGAPGSYTPSGPVIPILSYENNPNLGDGVYSYSYQTGNGIQAQESGRGGPGPQDGTAAQGSYSYTGPDGQTYTVTYTADANGFQAQGAHLPTPPPIPEEILKSLQFNAANPQSEYDTGAYTPGAGAVPGVGTGTGADSRGYLPPYSG